jgi:manganese-dependent inorganic pyrophosphatase
VEHPKLLMDVHPTVGQLCRRDVITAREDEPFFEVYRRMQNHRLHAMPVVDGAGRITGMLSLSSLLELLMPDAAGHDSPRLVRTTLEHIRRAFGGTFLHAVDPERADALILSVGAMSYEHFLPRLRERTPEQTLIVVGDRPTIQRPTIQYGARCLVVTGGHGLEPDLLEEARAKGVTVLSSPLDTASTALMIRGAKGIGPAVDRTFLKFREKQLARSVRKEVHPLPQELFPVVGDGGELLGVFSKEDLASPEPVRLVLVDHNELAQAVAGAEEAEILEVLDHHRVGGGLISREPIRFQNDTVGSTCTMVARCFRREGMVPPKGIAQCMAAGVISDTLNLSSPTTTPVDREMLAWLGEAGGFDVAAFAEAFFAMGSALQLSSPRDALRMDCKAYTEGPWNLAVAQIEEVGFQHFERLKEALKTELEDLVQEKRLDFACLLVTDISLNNSLLLVAGREHLIGAIDYPRLESDLFQLDTVVSRKKQLLPHLARQFARVDADSGAGALVR